MVLRFVANNFNSTKKQNTIFLLCKKYVGKLYNDLAANNLFLFYFSILCNF